MHTTIRKLLFICLLFLHANLLSANEYYWVGGSGKWSELGHWATTSGGQVFYTTIPGIGDNVHFDSRSFTAVGQMVEIDSNNATCASMDWTACLAGCGASGGNTLQINHSLTLYKGIAFNFTGIIEFTGTDGNFTLTSAENTFNCKIKMICINSNLTFSDNFKSTQAVYFDGLSSEFRAVGRFELQELFFRGLSSSLIFQDDLVINTNIEHSATLSAPSGKFETQKSIVVEGEFTIDAKDIDVKIDCPSKFKSWLIVDQGNFTSSDYPCSIGVFKSATQTNRKITFKNKVVRMASNWWINEANLELNVLRTTLDFYGPSSIDGWPLFAGGSNQHYHRLLFEKFKNGYYMKSENCVIDSIESLTTSECQGNNNRIGTGRYLAKTFFNGNNIYDTLYLGRGREFVFAVDKKQEVITKITADGDCTGSVVIRSAVDGKTSSIEKKTGGVSLDYIITKDIIAVSPTPFICNHSIDLGGNKNFEFKQAAGQKLYWVGGREGGNGNWEESVNWSFVSGGEGGACVPSPVDDVIFDENSFTKPAQKVLVSSDNVFCHDMTWSNIVGKPSISSTLVDCRMNIYGSLSLAKPSEMKFDYAGSVVFEAHDKGNTVRTSEQIITKDVIFNGTGGGWDLLDSLKVNGNIFLNNGSLDTKSHNMFCGYFISTFNISDRKLTLGSSKISVTQDWRVEGSQFVFDAGTSLIRMIGIKDPIFSSAADLTYYDLVFEKMATVGKLEDSNDSFHSIIFKETAHFFGKGTKVKYLEFQTIGRLAGLDNYFENAVFMKNTKIEKNNTFDVLSLSARYVYTLVGGVVMTINKELKANGNCSSFITIQTDAHGTPAFIKKASGTLAVDYVMLRDIQKEASSSAVYNASNAIDMGNNLGWNILSVSKRELYWVGGDGSWSQPQHWSLASGGTGGECIPTPLDNIHFDQNSFAAEGQVVTIDLENVYCHSVDWTGAKYRSSLKSAKLSGEISSHNWYVYGSMTLDKEMLYLLTQTSDRTIFLSDADETIETKAVTMGGEVVFDGRGSWSLSSDFITSDLVTHNSGTLITNDHVFESAGYLSDSQSQPVFTAGKSTIRMKGPFYMAKTLKFQSEDVDFIYEAKTSFTNNCEGTYKFKTLKFTVGGSITANLSGKGKSYFGDVQFYGGDIVSSVSGVNSTFERLYFANGSEINGPIKVDSLRAQKFCNIYGVNTFRSATFYEELVSFYRRNYITRANLLSDAVFYDNCDIDTLIMAPNHIYSLSAEDTLHVHKEMYARGNNCQKITIKSNTEALVAFIEKNGSAVDGYALALTGIWTKGDAVFYAGGTSSVNVINSVDWVLIEKPGTFYGLPRDSIFEQGAEAIVTTANFNGNSTTHYIWQDKSTGSVFKTKEPVQVVVRANYSETDNTCFLVDTMNIFFKEVTNVACAGQNTGSIILHADPKITYTYLWSSGETGTELHNLAAADYALTINDVSAKKVLYFTVKVGKQTSFDVLTRVVNPSCTHSGDGKIVAQLKGGGNNYSLIWNGVDFRDNTSLDSLTSLSGNVVYTLEASDKSSCPPVVKVFTLTEPDPLTVNFVSNNISCYGNTDGNVKALAYGGTAPYSFIWQQGSSSDSIGSLPSGTYELTLKDKNKCELKASSFILEPQKLSATVSSSTAPSCHDSINGRAVLATQFGTAPYSYDWVDFPSNHTNTVSGLAGGRYYVYTLSDKNKCTYKDSIKLASTSAIALEAASVSSLHCNGGNDATILVKAGGGAGSYSYYLEQLENTSGWFDHLTAGSYMLRVTDANQCSYLHPHAFVVREPEQAFDYKVTPIYVTKDNLYGGSITIDLGSNTDYTTLVTDQNNQVLTSTQNLGQGVYHIKVTDKQGCSVLKDVEIREYISSVVTHNIFTPNGDGANDLFQPQTKELASMHCTIFNRWGQKVYEWDGTENAWDGNVNGNPAPGGVYYYVIDGIGLDKNIFHQKGFFHLIR